MDEPTLDPGSHVPLYVQVADWIVSQVETGTLAAGTRLPAERDLAESWGVAYMTIRRAMAELRTRGIVVTVQGKGTFIL
jgi:DNA-binding GntR family transcriptional regulator